MTTGWILTVHDLLAKDRASKLCMLSHDDVTAKVAKLKIKGGDRVQVFANTPYSEVDTYLREVVRISASELNVKSIMRRLGKINPLLIEQTDRAVTVELDWDTDIRITLLESLTECNVETLNRPCSECNNMMKSTDGCWACPHCGNTAG